MLLSWCYFFPPPNPPWLRQAGDTFAYLLQSVLEIKNEASGRGLRNSEVLGATVESVWDESYYKITLEVSGGHRVSFKKPRVTCIFAGMLWAVRRQLRAFWPESQLMRKDVGKIYSKMCPATWVASSLWIHLKLWHLSEVLSTLDYAENNNLLWALAPRGPILLLPTHPFSKWFLNFFCMPGTVAGTG